MSSSILPDVPPDSALEDTAAICTAAQHNRGSEGLQQQPLAQRRRTHGGAADRHSQDAAVSESQPCSSGHDAPMAVPSEGAPEDMVCCTDIATWFCLLVLSQPLSAAGCIGADCPLLLGGHARSFSPLALSTAGRSPLP